jgi:hypothetical protein
MGRRNCLNALISVVVVVAGATVSRGQVVNSEWNTGNGAWNVPTNWFPNDVPDNGGGFTYDVEIGNRPVAANATVSLIPEDGASDTITSLVVSGGADLQTNGNTLFVTGQTTISGIGSSIFVEPAAGGGVAFNTDNLDINSSSALQMAGGTIDVDVLLEVNSGSITGHGLIIVGDGDGVVEVGLENSANILVGNTANAVLTLQANSVDVIDLDGTTETGLLDVSNVNANAGLDTLTLVVDAPLADAFSGTILIGQRDTITFNDNFTMDGADVQFDGGTQVATMNGAAAATDIANSVFTVTGDAVIANDLAFSGPGNTVTVNASSSLTLGGAVTLPPSALNLASSSAELIITGGFNSISIGEDFNWDGPGSAITTISGTGFMNLNVDQVDTGNDTYGGTLNLNDNGDVSVQNTANQWTAAGTINKNNAGTSVISGDRVVVTGSVNVNAGTLDMPAVTTSATANVNATGTLLFGSASELAGGTLTGTGLLRMEGTSTVTANTTIGVATFDWDGLGTGTNHTINDGVVFTINSTTLDSDGDMDDPINLGGNGTQLIVNGPTQWTATAAVNANNAGAGTATIGGTSRMILAGANADLNVNGNTVINAPLTLGASSLVVIDGGFTLDANGATTYSGVVIEGTGAYLPGPTNTVTAFSTIAPDIFDFDAGSWVVEPGATLTVNVTDYDTTVTNAFDSTITLNDGAVNVTTSDAEFVMDSVLNMVSNNVNLAFADWLGQPLDIGNDIGTLDADVNVSGTFFSRISAPVDFNSDADVNVAAGATLVLGSSVNFDTVNGPNNAEFTGAGTMAFNNTVNVNETVTLNMVGGTVDLDGNDATGEFINIDAPLTINAATMANFGRVNGGGGVNTLDINSLAGTGVLTVNLDDPNAEWTLNAAGVMNLVNDGGGGFLIAGSDVNLDGTVNVTGAAGISARVDIAGTINVANLSALTLAGSNLADPNRLVGGTINGPGFFSVSTGRGLRGFGTINPNVNYTGSAELLADDGTLTLNGAIADVGKIGTADADGVLNVVNAWNSSGADNVVLVGGELKGGTVTVGNANGIQGHGTITARVINTTKIVANGGTLIVETAANDNDWDGAANTGLLRADAAATLELRDTGAAFVFGGTVSAADGGRVYASGFGLDFSPTSTLSLTAATFQADESTDLGGAVTIGAGLPSTIQVQNNRFLSFETGSTTTLNANLTLLNNNINVEDGATFSGGGALVIPDGSHLVVDNQADVGVLLEMYGAFRPGNSEGIGRVNLQDYQQYDSGELFVEMKGTSLNEFDRLVASGDVIVDGYLNIDIDEIAPMVPFVPVLGNTFNIITANSVSGQFDYYDVSGMPPGLAFKINYLANAVQLQVVNEPFFSADFDDDGDVDPTDLQIWKGAYHLNQLGDADGDNDSDGADFLKWQQQLGSKPTAVAASAAVPEPASLAGAVVACLAWAAVRRRRG